MTSTELGLKVDDLKKILAVFENHLEIERVIVYGSRAKGNYKPYSDIDITLIGNIDLTTENKIDLNLDDLLLPYKFDISVFHNIKNADLIEHINRVGKTIYTSKKMQDLTKEQQSV